MPILIDLAVVEMDEVVEKKWLKMQQQLAQEHAKGSVKPKKPLTDEEVQQLFEMKNRKVRSPWNCNSIH